MPVRVEYAKCPPLQVTYHPIAVDYDGFLFQREGEGRNYSFSYELTSSGASRWAVREADLRDLAHGLLRLIGDE